MTNFVGRYRQEVERLVHAVLATAGDTRPSLRRAVEERAAAVGGCTAAPADETLPAAVEHYVSKVALHAYKVTEADVATLRDAGYSEDAIFEITLSAAMGAALGRLARGLGALRGARYETQNG